MPRIEVDTTIEQNLAAYLEANADAAPSNFRIKRELDLARHALEESLAIHGIVTKLLKTAINTLGTTESDLIKLIALANNLEERHNKLQQAAKNAASIAKTGAEVEMLLSSKLDAAQVYSIIAQLPTLLLSLTQAVLLGYFKENNFSIVNGRVLSLEEVIPNVANVLANAFNDEIEKSINVLTYSDKHENKAASSSGNGAQAGGIIEAQVVAMLNTVPLNTVVSPTSPEAKLIRELTEVELVERITEEVE